MASQRDDPVGTAALYQVAQEIVEEIARQIGVPTLRDALLGLPQVDRLRSV